MSSLFAVQAGSRGSKGVAGFIAGLSPRGRALLIAAEVVILLVIWQVLVGSLGLVNAVFFPPPLDVVDGLGDLIAAGTLGQAAASSAQSWLTGYGMAVLIAVPLGLLMGTSVPVDRVFGPIAWTLYAAPAVAYAPLTKAWFGFGAGPVVFLVVISAVFPIMLNLAAGIRTTSPSLLRAARVYGASRMEIYRKILLPSTVPFLFAGLRQGAVLATIGMVVAEITGSTVGMGAVIIRSANTYNTDQSFAAIALIVLWSISMTQLVSLIERIVAPWNRKKVSS